MYILFKWELSWQENLTTTILNTVTCMWANLAAISTSGYWLNQEILHQTSILAQLRMLLVCIPSARPPHYIDMPCLWILFKKNLY